MDLQAVKTATGPELAAGAAAAARNASDLLEEAELLASAHYTARAVSLAALAIEEVGKSQTLCALAGLPDNIRPQAPIRRMLEWHGLKQAAGQLIAEVEARPTRVAADLLALPPADLDAMLVGLEGHTDEADQLKRQGLYVDYDSGRISEPREVTAAELSRQLSRARRATRAAIAITDHREQARLVRPSEAGIELARAAFTAFTGAEHVRTPRDASQLMRETVTGLIQRCGPTSEQRAAAIAVTRVAIYQAPPPKTMADYASAPPRSKWQRSR